MIRLLSCGYHYVHRDGIVIDRPTGAGNYAFVLFKSDAEIVVRGHGAAASKNSFILFQPSTPHLYRDAEPPFVNDWFHCEGDELAPFLARLRFPLDQPVRAADPSAISRSIMDMQNVHRMGGPLREEIVDLDIRCLLAKLSDWQQRAPLPEATDRYFRPFAELRTRLYSEPQTHVTVESLAAGVNLSKSYFQHLYKDLFGCSVVHDMIQGRLEQAKYLLRSSSYSVAAIADMCGYDNDTHFMRQFKKFVGVTPSRFRKPDHSALAAPSYPPGLTPSPASHTSPHGSRRE
ncbi:helix-turn-helix domain-containing protein [Paenibacillus cymbidii]|uniref:helix-turn-helix domain-containing protein n=1 Tax=Paenibacillus cymbidii TaxID=1639034 RepID=UPI0010815118|nr:AraC family transcriptional regulator [Paenibacillus cymbidii]